jgi:hypothetical protein
MLVNNLMEDMALSDIKKISSDQVYNSTCGSNTTGNITIERAPVPSNTKKTNSVASAHKRTITTDGPLLPAK